MPDKYTQDKHTQTLRVGTRESKLALLQTQTVIDALHQKFPDLHCEIKPITTKGDKVLNKPIADLGSRGVFVKELEEALLLNEVDLVIHSLKDLPTNMPSGLTLAAVLNRIDPRDVLVSHNNIPLDRLPPGSRIATSSRRRAAQLKALRNDLVFIDIRGNIPTRIKKHEEGLCDAMVLAAAGLIRLGITDKIAQYLEPSISTPAVGQGALAVECRNGDQKILGFVNQINIKNVRAEITAERAFLHTLGGGCSVPIGALCTTLPDGQLQIHGCVATLDGAKIIRHSKQSSAKMAEQLGITLAEEMLQMGAAPILDALKESIPAPVSPP